LDSWDISNKLGKYVSTAFKRCKVVLSLLLCVAILFSNSYVLTFAATPPKIIGYVVKVENDEYHVFDYNEIVGQYGDWKSGEVISKFFEKYLEAAPIKGFLPTPVAYAVTDDVEGRDFYNYTDLVGNYADAPGRGADKLAATFLMSTAPPFGVNGLTTVYWVDIETGEVPQNLK